MNTNTKQDKMLTELQAFKAMVLFLENYYALTSSDDVGSLLGDLQLLKDGTTADPSVWPDWIACTHRSLKAK